MVKLQSAVRMALPSDHTNIANLMYFESKVHRHLDWRTPLEWLGAPEYWVLEHYGSISAALACPPDPENVAWLRLFAASTALPYTQAWETLWETARLSLQNRGLTVAAIVVHDWLKDLLLNSGFEEKQQIVVLEKNSTPMPLQACPPEILIRPMTAADLPIVARLDAASFGWLWQNSLFSLQNALAQAEISTVAQRGDQLLAYQMSTRNPFGVHLARLAVRPDMQGRGLGYLMVQDLFQKARQVGLTRLTVNTQNDNSASLSLYQKIGFRRTGEHYTVYLNRP